VHGDREIAAIDLHQKVVIVDSIAVERITRCSRDRIRPGAAAAGHEVDDTVVFLMLIIVYVPGKHHEASMGAALPLFSGWRAE